MRKGKKTVEDQVDQLLEGEARRLDEAAGRAGPRKAKGRRKAKSERVPPTGE